MSGPVIKVRVIRQPVLKARMLSQWPARVAVGSVTTGEPGTSATVENVGTAGSAVLNFTIPRGNDGIVQSLVAGSNITINATDPAHPIINSTASGSGDVVGPSSAVDGTPTVFNGTSGKLLKNITFSAFKTLLSLVKGDVGLGNVDNTSDSTKNAAAVTLTNKTLTSPVINGATGSAASSFTATTQAARDNSTKLATTAYVDRTTRELLTANRTYYVRTDGSDSNNGLANTSGGAFLTIQKAWNTILTLDLAGNTVTIQLADGTYTAGLSISAPALGGTVILNGNSSTPTNVIINSAIGVGLYAPGSAITVQNLRLSCSDICLAVQSPGSQATIGPGMSFAGSPANCHINIAGGKVLAVNNNFTIASGGRGWIQVTTFGALETSNLTITFSGTPAWSGEGINAVTGLVSLWNTTLSGSATGKRYSVSANGVINSFGAGTSSTYFPGNSNGTSASGGQQN